MRHKILERHLLKYINSNEKLLHISENSQELSPYLPKETVYLNMEEVKKEITPTCGLFSFISLNAILSRVMNPKETLRNYLSLTSYPPRFFICEPDYSQFHFSSQLSYLEVLKNNWIEHEKHLGYNPNIGLEIKDLLCQMEVTKFEYSQVIHTCSNPISSEALISLGKSLCLKFSQYPGAEDLYKKALLQVTNLESGAHIEEGYHIFSNKQSF